MLGKGLCSNFYLPLGKRSRLSVIPKSKKFILSAICITGLKMGCLTNLISVFLPVLLFIRKINS